MAPDMKRNEADKPDRNENMAHDHDERLLKSIDIWITQVASTLIGEPNPCVNHVRHDLLEKYYEFYKRLSTNDLKPSNPNNIETQLRNALTGKSRDYIVDVFCRMFQNSSVVVHNAINQSDSLYQLEEKLARCKRELDQHRVSVIDLQKKVIELQEKQLEEATSTVQQVRAYSTVLSQNCSVVARTPAVKQDKTPVSQSTGKEKNLVIFGLQESHSERLMEKSVETLFEHLQEKPKITAIKHIGQKRENTPRPLLVTLERRETLLSLLRKARTLKNSDQFSNVYLSPDLTPQQLRERKVLVETLKKLRRDDPGGVYQIRGNIIVVR